MGVCFRFEWLVDAGDGSDLDDDEDWSDMDSQLGITLPNEPRALSSSSLACSTSRGCSVISVATTSGSADTC